MAWRVFLDGYGAAGFIKCDDTKVFRITDLVGKHAGTRWLTGRFAELVFQSVTKKQVVTEDQGTSVIVNEILTDQKSLRKTIRRRLYRIGQVDAPLRTIAKHLFETPRIVRRGDNQNIPQSGQHEGGQRVVNHWFVINRQQLFAYPQRHRMQSRAGAAGQNNTLAGNLAHEASPRRSSR